jgi:hypothetical protein
MSAYKYKNAIGVSLPAFCHLYVFFLSPLKIHREQRFRAVREVGLSLWSLILCRRIGGILEIAYGW